MNRVLLKALFMEIRLKINMDVLELSVQPFQARVFISLKS
jgi:hypothetical protein